MLCEVPILAQYVKIYIKILIQYLYTQLISYKLNVIYGIDIRLT